MYLHIVYKIMFLLYVIAYNNAFSSILVNS